MLQSSLPVDATVCNIHLCGYQIPAVQKFLIQAVCNTTNTHTFPMQQLYAVAGFIYEDKNITGMMDYVVVRSALSRISYRNFFSYRQHDGIDKIYWSLLRQTSDVLLNPGQLSD